MAARLAGVVVDSVDVSQGEASWAQLLRADSRNSHGTPARETIPAWSPPGRVERSMDGELSARGLWTSEGPTGRTSPRVNRSDRSMDVEMVSSGLSEGGGYHYDARPLAGRGVPQELLELRTALTAANAARRAAEGTLQSVISGDPPRGYALGRGVQPMRRPATGGAGAGPAVSGACEGEGTSSVQLHEAVRLRWAERQSGRQDTRW
jgi:hypothetical protein